MFFFCQQLDIIYIYYAQGLLFCQVIYGPSDASEIVHFILSGECRIVRELFLVRIRMSRGEPRFYLLSPSEVSAFENSFSPETPNRYVRNEVCKLGYVAERKLWTIGTLKRGNFFAVGECKTCTVM